VEFGKGFILGLIAALAGLFSLSVVKNNRRRKEDADDDKLYDLKDAKVTGRKEK
jgi:hypothetical protein